MRRETGPLWPFLCATFSSNLQPSPNNFNQGQTSAKKPQNLNHLKNIKSTS